MARVVMASLLLACSSASRTIRKQQSAHKSSSQNSCTALGWSMESWSDCSALTEAGEIGQTSALQGKVTWAVPVPGMGLALCDEVRSILTLQAEGEMVDVSLAPLSNPVGAVFFEGLVYVAMFGGETKSGLAVVDPFAKTLVATHAFPGGSFVHNVYEFSWKGKSEIFVAVLGNPWASPPVPGNGLVRFDRQTGSFITETTTGGLNARSAVQASEGVFYALTQEPAGAPTKLVRLEANGENLAVTSSTSLPARAWGDGGADVFLAQDGIFATDRAAGAGKLYFYKFEQGAFHLKTTRDTGPNPRYTNVVGDDVIACNQWGPSLTIFEGLALDPTASNIPTRTVPTVPEVSFFLAEAN